MPLPIYRPVFTKKSRLHKMKTTNQEPKNFLSRISTTWRKLDPGLGDMLFFFILVAICAGAVCICAGAVWLIKALGWQ